MSFVCLRCYFATLYYFVLIKNHASYQIRAIRIMYLRKCRALCRNLGYHTRINHSRNKLCRELGRVYSVILEIETQNKPLPSPWQHIMWHLQPYCKGIFDIVSPGKYMTICDDLITICWFSTTFIAGHLFAAIHKITPIFNWDLEIRTMLPQ